MENGRMEEIQIEELEPVPTHVMSEHCHLIGCNNKATITIDKLDYCTQHTPIHCKKCMTALRVVYTNSQKFKDPDSRDLIISTKWFCEWCGDSFRTERRIGDLERFPRGRRKR